MKSSFETCRSSQILSAIAASLIRLPSLPSSGHKLVSVAKIIEPFATSFLFLVVMPLLVAMPWLLASPFWGVQPPGTGSWTAQRAAQRGWAPTCSSVRPWVDASGGPGIETRDPAIPSRFCRRQLVYVSIVFACQGMTGSMNSYSHDFPFIVHDSFTTHFTRIISD